MMISTPPTGHRPPRPAFVARRHGQAGFTLVELITVIVILGVLAATALPKFVNLGSDARTASVKAVGGALATTSAMVHGKALIDPSATTVTNENVVITLEAGYPSAARIGNMALAAGLDSADYTIRYGSATATATQPGLPINSFAAIPTDVQNTPKALGCYAQYTGASGSGDAIRPPVVTVVTSSC